MEFPFKALEGNNACKALMLAVLTASTTAGLLTDPDLLGTKTHLGFELPSLANLSIVVALALVVGRICTIMNPEWQRKS